MRRAFVLAHRWVALVAGLLLALLGLTGSVMVWQAEIDAALNPQWFARGPACAAAARPVAEVLAVLAREAPDARPALVLAPPVAGAAYQVWDYVGHGRALLGTIAIRRGQFERAQALLAESLALYREVDSSFDIAGSLAQQGFLALRRNDPAQALALFAQSLPTYRNHPGSPGATRGLAQLMIAFAACGRWSVAARLAGVLGDESAPAELSGTVKRSYDDALADARRALGANTFAGEVRAGRSLDREAAIDYALAAAG
jgi:tetratricopeptide (TPR) repeat protein